VKFSDGQFEFLRVFNFAILCYTQNSRKLDAREKLVFYSNFGYGCVLRNDDSDYVEPCIVNRVENFRASLWRLSNMQV